MLEPINGQKNVIPLAWGQIKAIQLRPSNFTIEKSVSRGFNYV